MGQTTLSARELAAKLVGLLEKGEFEKAQNELFSQDIVSFEFSDAEGRVAETKGLAAILNRTRQFQAMLESVQGLKISAPLVQGNAIALEFELDFTAKGAGRQQLAEIILYVVKDGKITHEQFFN